MANIQITQSFTLECAHQLTWHPGVCSRLHGHRYNLDVTVSGPLNEHGVVMNFEEVETIVKQKVITMLDHQYLNDIMDNPTAENIIVWIWDALKDFLPLYELKLYETEGSYVTYQG